MEIIHFLDDIGQPYSCSDWGGQGIDNIPPIVNDGIENIVAEWFSQKPNSAAISYPLTIFVDSNMQMYEILDLEGEIMDSTFVNSTFVNAVNAIIERMLSE